jgi:hypothetical protein
MKERRTYRFRRREPGSAFKEVYIGAVQVAQGFLQCLAVGFLEGMRLVAVGQTETQNARGATRKTWKARQCGIEARIPRL